MKYYVTVNKKYQYVRVYNIIKRPNESSNKISKFASSLIERFILKQKKEQ